MKSRDVRRLDNLAGVVIILGINLLLVCMFYYAYHMDEPSQPEPDLLWADMDVDFLMGYIQTHFPDHDPTEIEFVWRIADLGGVARGYWIVREVEE